MTISIRPCDAVLGAVIEGMSLAQVPDSALVEEIETALEKFGVLVFRNQHLSPRQQIEFSQAFAPLELTELEKARLPDYPEIFVVGNVGNGLVSFAPAVPGGELEWHTDHIHHEVPARASLLYALEVPAQGGDTLFACMYHAYNNLDKEKQDLCLQLEGINSAEGLEHFLKRQSLGDTTSSVGKRQYQYIKRPLVREHPISGRRALYFGNQVTIGIDGWEDEDARRFIYELTEHACQSAFRYRHQWENGDVVLWDNRRVLHAGTPYDVVNTRRHMHRTTWRETEPVRLVV